MKEKDELEAKEMPNTTTDVNGLVTRHVFLDTQVYRQYAYNLNHTLMQAFSKRLGTGKLQLHITDITLSEIESQLHEEKEELLKCLKKATRKINQWNNRVLQREQISLPEINGHQLHQTAFHEIKSTLTRRWGAGWNAELHKAKELPAINIFDDYFKRNPPFSTKDKQEFPDAFITASLQQWCAEKNKTMYVITDDKEMLKTADKSEFLEPIESLPKFLDLLNATEKPELEKQADKLIENDEVLDQLNEYIEEHIDDIEICYDGELPEAECCSTHSASISYVSAIYIINSTDECFDLVIDLMLLISATLDIPTGSGHYATAEIEEEGSDPFKLFVSINKKEKKLKSVEIIDSEISFSEPYGYFH